MRLGSGTIIGKMLRPGEDEEELPPGVERRVFVGEVGSRVIPAATPTVSTPIGSIAPVARLLGPRELAAWDRFGRLDIDPR